ncbi:MAG TPA: hypothetical protein VFM48_13765, partial [Aquabacterium sp.]|nr:hypothetical protein [Aquabacterium sp.]
MNLKRVWLLRGVALLIGIASTSMTLTACQPRDGGSPATSAAKAGDAAHFNAVDITGADYARRLSMKDFDGKPRSLDEFKGKVVFLFFGYT